MARFTIFPALKEDVNQGWIWIHKSQLPSGSPQRSIVKLSASDTSKYVYCEARFIDGDFEYDYNPPDDNNDDKKSCRLKRCRRSRIDDPKSTLVAAEWYQIRLGVENVTEAEIKVTPANHCYGHIRACLDHPQIVVRLATKLGLLGVALGLIGIIPVVHRIIDFIVGG